MTPATICWLSSSAQYLCSNLESARGAPPEGQAQGSWLGGAECPQSAGYKQTPGQMPTYLIEEMHQALMDKGPTWGNEE
jgi:hypothetical protein